MLTLPQRARWTLLLPLLCATAGCPWIGDTGALADDTEVLDDGTDPIEEGTDPDPDSDSDSDSDNDTDTDTDTDTDSGCQTAVFGETTFNESCFGE